MKENDLRDLLPPERPLPVSDRRAMKERLMERIPDEATASRSRVTRRVALAAVATLVVLAGIAAAVVAAGEDDDDTVTVPADSTETTTTTTRPTTTTTRPTTTTEGTTTSTTPGTTTSSTPSRPGTTTSGSGPDGPATARPPVRDIDFANETYVRPCPSLADMDVTLADGSGFMETVSNENGYNVELQPVIYGDADGDGDENAMVVLFCHHQRAEEAAVWVAMFGVSTDGRPLAIGDPRRVENVAGRPTVPAMGTITVPIYPQPGSQGEPVNRTWRFDGNTFQPAS